MKFVYIPIGIFSLSLLILLLSGCAKSKFDADEAIEESKQLKLTDRAAAFENCYDIKVQGGKERGPLRFELFNKSGECFKIILEGQTDDSFCERVSKERISLCYLYFSQINSRKESCHKIDTDDGWWGMCINDYFRLTNDSSICDYYSGKNLDRCYYMILLCDEITDAKIKEDCIIGKEIEERYKQ